MNGSRSMEFSSCCPQAGCPGGKTQKTVFRGDFSRKSLKKLSDNNNNNNNNNNNRVISQISILIC